MMPMSAQSSLSHYTMTRPGMVAGSRGTMESRAPRLPKGGVWWTAWDSVSHGVLENRNLLILQRGKTVQTTKNGASWYTLVHGDAR